ncbi:hypothetical protein Nos7524_4089 [Nostoc sp. PCC 7524]|uniref:hypothetical protein n=1 Tax=Nostoc sp. (strain ATCC 29411 / PCC 7524) TaxID=28072 RepID=UPI00029F143E|nr:hypothetical protein [Nostoc sp. PCC 7524]AFY49859.1 hypothetical protein Nos7524_4089 [Nostoc sp. PCC 7524]
MELERILKNARTMLLKWQPDDSQFHDARCWACSDLGGSSIFIKFSISFQLLPRLTTTTTAKH